MCLTSPSSSEGLDRIRYLPENKVLKQDLTVPINDDSPIFTLEEAEVYKKDGKTFANLLHGDIEGPFIIRGRLCIEDHEVKELKCLIHKKLARSYIEFACTQYSVGELPTTIWAAGGAGWFEIYPSHAYKEIHESMLNGVELYYGLIQVYEKVLNSGDKYWRTKMSAEDVFIQYGLNNGTGLYRSEILARIYENAQFLLCHLHKANHGSYSTTSLCKYLSENFQDIYEKLLQKQKEANGFYPIAPSIPKTKGKVVVSASSAVTGGNEAGEHPKEGGTKGTRSSLRSRLGSQGASERNALAQPPILQASTGDATASPFVQPTVLPSSALATVENPARTTAEVVELMLECMEILLGEGKDRNRITLATLGSQFYKDYKFPLHQTGPEIVRYHARALLARLPPDWKHSTLEKTCRDERVFSYNQLSDAAKKALQGGIIRRDRAPHKRGSPISTNRKEDGVGRGRKGASVPDAFSSLSASPHPGQGHSFGASYGNYAGKIPSLRTPGGSVKRLSESPDDDDEDYIADVLVTDLGVIPPELLRDKPKPPRKRSRPGAAYNQDNLPLYYPNGEERLTDGYVRFDIVEEDMHNVPTVHDTMGAGLSFAANKFGSATNKDPSAIKGRSSTNNPSTSRLNAHNTDRSKNGTNKPSNILPDEASTLGLPIHTSSFDDTEVLAATGLWLCPHSPCVFMIPEIETESGKRGYLKHKDFHKIEENVLKEASFSRSSVSHLMEKIKAAGESNVEKSVEYINGKQVKRRIVRRGEES